MNLYIKRDSMFALSKRGGNFFVVLVENINVLQQIIKIEVHDV